MRLVNVRRLVLSSIAKYSVLQSQERKTSRFDPYRYLDCDLMDLLDLKRRHAEKASPEGAQKRPRTTI